MLPDQPHDPTDLVRSEATIDYERYRIEPELGHRPLPCHVDVRRFATVGTEENETVRSIPKHGGHNAVYRVMRVVVLKKDILRRKEKGSYKL
jgi:hypothetical protein